MDTATAPLAAVHLAVLVEVGPSAPPAGEVWAVLVYDGCGYRHLHRLDPALPADRLALGQHGPGQLQLPIGEATERPTSSGLGWQTFVLPSIPVELRGLPAGSLAAAFADRLTREADRGGRS
jgi:hypothetical protein